MRIPSSRRGAFTLVEMLVVMVVIAILVGIVLSIANLVQNTGARKRAEGEIHSLTLGCESYKADNGSYPQSSVTDALDPRASGAPTSYEAASLFLYQQLSGDLDANGRTEPNGATPEPKNYLPDFFKPANLQYNSGGTVGSAGYVKFIKDPWGNSYGYSSKGAVAEQKYRTDVLTNPAATRPANQGYNPTYDLWSTGGKTVAPNPGNSADITPAWIKNW